jgi:sugar (pentulose or hexulose) kinase
MRDKISEACKHSGGDVPETPGEYAAVIQTSLALKYRWAMDRLSELRGRDFRSVNMIGGGSRSALAAQLTADATGLPVQCGPVDAAALGNAVFQLLATGEIKNTEEGREIVQRSISPQLFVPRGNDHITQRPFRRPSRE